MPELKDKIKGASQQQLILMLYEGAIRFAGESKERMQAKDKPGAHDKITRAQNIVLELLYALDMKAGGAVAENLSSLYKYVYHRWVEADIHQSTERVEEGVGIMRGLKDAWTQALDNLDRKVAEDAKEKESPKVPS